MSPKLHHFAFNIKPNTLELVLEMFKIFDCTLSFRDGSSRWCMIEQKPLAIDIQIVEKNDKQIPTEIKTSTHIAFLSECPAEDIQKIENWAKENSLTFQKGGWSEKELWFDLPDIFLNFVIEVMHTSVVKG